MYLNDHVRVSICSIRSAIILQRFFYNLNGVVGPPLCLLNKLDGQVGPLLYLNDPVLVSIYSIRSAIILLRFFYKLDGVVGPPLCPSAQFKKKSRKWT